MKEKGTPVFANKFQFVMNRPLEEVAYKYILMVFDPEFGQVITWREVYSDGEGSSLHSHFIIYSIAKFGGIFQDRDFAILCRYFKISENTIVLVVESAEAVPPNKRFIRSTVYKLSGYHFKSLSPTSTQITSSLHVNISFLVFVKLECI